MKQNTLKTIALALLILAAPGIQASERPNILITNDDGITTPGIQALVEAMSTIGNVLVAAPAANQSGTGSSITLKPIQDENGQWRVEPIKATRFERDDQFFGFAVEGTPADSIRFGFAAQAENGGVDLVVSGINKGSNLGEAVRLSGTIGAAMTAAARGVPAIAVSASTRTKDFGPAASIVSRLAQQVLKHGLPTGTLLSVNVPFNPKEGAVTAPNHYVGERSSRVREVIREGDNGEVFYELKFDGPKSDKKSKNNDSHYYSQEKRITITPIRLDWTDYKTMSELNYWNLDSIEETQSTQGGTTVK